MLFVVIIITVLFLLLLVLHFGARLLVDWMMGLKSPSFSAHTLCYGFIMAGLYFRTPWIDFGFNHMNYFGQWGVCVCV